MKLQLLLVFMFFNMGFLKAQDTIRTLIFSEVRMADSFNPYVELTNVGSDTLDLSNFEIGKFGPWDTPWRPSTGQGLEGNWRMLPKVKLAPGKSFVIAKVADYTHKMWLKNPQDFSKNGSQPEMLKLADMQVHFPETNPQQPQSIDSVSFRHGILNGMWSGWDCIYLRYHYYLPGGIKDSVFIDQVGGVFDNSDGHNTAQAHAVAGISDATWSRILVRKFKVKQGDLNFAINRGTSLEESDWIPLPILGGNFTSDRAVLWTVGNHGDYHLSSLEPSATSKMIINWQDSTLTVPWGVRRDDSLMYQFKRVPGMGWWYDYSKKHSDSAYCSVRSGDSLTVYACGNKMEKIIFKVRALPPTVNDNLVIPLKVPDYRNGNYVSASAYCEVSDNAPAMDTIFNIGYATPTDSLTKYLEKPPKATLKYIFVDGLDKRANLKTGDLLEVTSENGKVKTYYIKTRGFWPSHDASLSSITFPEVPDDYKGILGWKGDTIPSFSSSVYAYQLKVPYDVIGIPALIAKTNHLNAKVKVDRAVNLVGSLSERTITFTVTAEDDTSKKVYTIELIKGKDPQDIQPWKDTEPFISQFVWKGWWGNTLLEIVNPGPEPIDLSHYMVSAGWFTDAAGGVTSNTGLDSYNNRYARYVPGRNWLNRAEWALTPGALSKSPDPVVIPLVQPGDVFVMAVGCPDFVANQVDIDFNKNPWGDTIQGKFDVWSNNSIFLYKILNDSVRNGLKPANDPKDFKLIDVWGDNTQSQWKIGGVGIDQNACYIRKPLIWQGNPNVNDYTANKGSFGSSQNNSEWFDRSHYYWTKLGQDYWNVLYSGIGVHNMEEVTFYKSTIKSFIYKVSEGYSNNESIKGVIYGTTAENFLSNIIKADAGQRLTLRSAADGSIYTDIEVLMNGDSLIVVSRDSSATSRYVLNVTPSGLSKNDTLTSGKYAITITGTTGKISGIKVGTNLKDVVEAVTIPDYATMTIIDTLGSYISTIKLNFDTTYSYVKASDKILFEVIAEDGLSKIIYQLQTISSSSDVYVLSDVYSVDTTNLIIQFIPGGTTVKGLFANLTPAPGATIKLYDKNGLERTFGYISLDDKLEVIAADGTTTKSYILEILGVNKPLAYVLSKTLSVDQVGLKIKGAIKETLTVSAFIANLTPSFGATIQILDEQGAVKLGTANLAKGDVVLVTSSDGLLQTTYLIIFDATSVPNVNNVAGKLLVYPNPSNGIVHILGLEKDFKIYVYNLLGILIQEKIAQQQEEIMSLKLPNGVYFIRIIAKGQQDITRKIILE